MDYSKYTPFIAEGRSLEIIKEFQAEREAASRRIKDLTEEFGAASAIRQRAVIGFVFKDNKHPEGWKRKGRLQGKDYYAPERRKKADKEIWKRMSAATVPGGSELHKAFTGFMWGVMTDEAGPRGGLMLRYVTYEHIGDQTVIFVPVGTKDEDKFAPPDARPIKMSELWTMKEAA